MWKHKKFAVEFRGHYYRDGRGERVFVLTAILTNGKIRNVSFESHEAAKQLGWRKV